MFIVTLGDVIELAVIAILIVFGLISVIFISISEWKRDKKAKKTLDELKGSSKED